MNAKIQKEFVLSIGSNLDITEEQLNQKALELEMLGNKHLDVRVHISAKEEL